MTECKDKMACTAVQQFVTSQNTTVVLLDAVFLPLIHCFKLTDAATFTLLLEPQKIELLWKKMTHWAEEGWKSKMILAPP